MDEQLLGSNCGPAPEVALSLESSQVPMPRGPMPQAPVLPNRQVSIHVVRDAQDRECPFWVGITSKGPHAPLTLLGTADTTHVLTTASLEGTSEDGPLLLVDAVSAPSRSILLLSIPEPTFRDRTLWVEAALAALGAWSPPTLGFYFAPGPDFADPQLALLLMTLRHVLLALGTSTVYLVAGAHGLNPMLNAALQLRAELQAEAVDLYIYH